MNEPRKKAKLLIQEFQSKLRVDWTLKRSCLEHPQSGMCYCEDDIVRTKPLRKWLSEKAPGDTSSKGEQLLKQLVKTSKREESYKYGFKSVLDEKNPKRPEEPNPKQSILIMSCLIDYDPIFGHVVLDFCDAGIWDQNFISVETTRNQTLKRKLNEVLQSDKDVTNILKDFEKRKWAFCPMIINDKLLEGSSHGEYRENLRLPFSLREDVCGHGGQATVRPVEVHEDFIEYTDPKMRRVLEAAMTERKNEKFYRLALKSYPSNFSDQFEAERDAFEGLEEVPEVIHYFGSFKHHCGQFKDNVCYYLILELGDRNLYEHFKAVRPPVFSKEINLTWETILKGAQALRAVHVVQYDKSRQLNGWHGDIKPENFLFVRGELKLTDFGFFAIANRAILEKCLLGTTQSYAPPEKDEKKRQAFDTWSFGCVLSIAATWIVMGTNGVLLYEDHRQKAYKQAFPKEKYPIDQFHDGKNVFRAIHAWHEQLREAIRPSDFITSQILELVDDHLFKSDPEKRYDSGQLCTALDDIMVEARRFAQYSKGLALYQAAIPGLLKRTRHLIQVDRATAFDPSNWSDQVAQFNRDEQTLEDAAIATRDVQVSLLMSEQDRLQAEQDRLKAKDHRDSVENSPQILAEDRMRRLSMSKFLNTSGTGPKRSASSRLLDPSRPTSGRAAALSELLPLDNQSQPPVPEMPLSLCQRSSSQQSSSRRSTLTGLVYPEIPAWASEIPHTSETQTQERKSTFAPRETFSQSVVHAVPFEDWPLSNEAPAAPIETQQADKPAIPEPKTSGNNQPPQDKSHLDPQPESTTSAASGGNQKSQTRTRSDQRRETTSSGRVRARSSDRRTPSVSYREVARPVDGARQSISNDSLHAAPVGPLSGLLSFVVERLPEPQPMLTPPSDKDLIFQLAKDYGAESSKRIRNLVSESQEINLAELKNSDGQTPLIVAAQTLALRNVEELMLWSDISEKDNADRTVLHHLIQSQIVMSKTTREFDKRFISILKALLEKDNGKNLVYQLDEQKHSPLYIACTKRDSSDATLEVVQILLREMQSHEDDPRNRRALLKEAIDKTPLGVLEELGASNYITSEDWKQVIPSPPRGRSPKDDYIREKVFAKDEKPSKLAIWRKRK